MIHTALEIRPSDLIPKVDRATLRKRLFPPQTRPQAREEVKPGNQSPRSGNGLGAAPKRVVMIIPPVIDVPLWQMRDIRFDHHVRQFEMRKVTPIKAYIMGRCWDIGITFEDLTKDRASRAVSAIKHGLMLEVWERFEPSYPELAKHFGLADHTSALYAVKKARSKQGWQRP